MTKRKRAAPKASEQPEPRDRDRLDERLLDERLLDERLDEALEETFPASDPVALTPVIPSRR